MGPPKRRYVGEEFGWAIQSCPLSPCHSVSELFGIPINDDGGQQIEASDAEVLSFRGTVADFSLTPDPKSTFQGVMCLSLVKADMGAALHVGVEQPFDDEQCAFDPADLPQGQRQIMLPRARGQFLEEVTWLHPARQHCCDTAQNIRPVFDDLRFPNFVPG